MQRRRIFDDDLEWAEQQEDFCPCSLLLLCQLWSSPKPWLYVTLCNKKISLKTFPASFQGLWKKKKICVPAWKSEVGKHPSSSERSCSSSWGATAAAHSGVQVDRGGVSPLDGFRSAHDGLIKRLIKDRRREKTKTKLRAPASLLKRLVEVQSAEKMDF